VSIDNFTSLHIGFMLLLTGVFQPEWYFTQLLTWIRNHQEFLKKRIQPELEKAEFGHIDALVS